MDRKTVLVVDDSESVCTAIAALLAIKGYATLTAYDGEEGVSMAQRDRPDLILLDLMMPVLDGWGAIKLLKADPMTSRIPVLALTALRLSEEEISLAGFHGYLSKPVPPHRLAEEVARACGES